MTVTLPNGAFLTTEGTGTLNLPSLPEKATEAFFLPGLEHNSLISIGTLCDAGCTATFDKQSITIRNCKNEVVLKGNRNPTTKLWQLPLYDNKNTVNKTDDVKLQLATTVLHKHPIKYLVTHMHACLFSPALSTLITATKKWISK